MFGCAHICGREEEELAAFDLENVTISILDVYMTLLQTINCQKF
jgi:hypothetical protein